MTQPLSSRQSFLIKSLFFLSGLTGLVYEVVWTRILTTVLGSTSLAISVSVSIFMAGLAIGSFLGARLSLRKWSVFGLYGFLEALIGGYAVATPWLAALVERMYAAKYAALAGKFLASVILKALLSSVLLLLPAVAMGATLPILIRLYDPEQRLEQAARLYGLNTAGAVLGALLSGYLLVPSLGISRTIFVTACLNGLIALVALSNRTAGPQKEDLVVPRVHRIS